MSFGKNWMGYVRAFEDKQVEIAKSHALGGNLSLMACTTTPPQATWSFERFKYAASADGLGTLRLLAAICISASTTAFALSGTFIIALWPGR
jgi:hypothetical protein